MTDEDIRKIAEGDVRAFHNVFFEYYGQVKQFSYFVLKDIDAAEDIAQEVFIKVWTGRGVLPEVRNFRNYLFQISKNTMIDHIRRETAMVLRNNVFAGRAFSRDDSFENDFIAKETQGAIDEIVGNMPPKRREVFILNRVQGKSNDEIAELLGLSKKTVENHLHLALKELKEKLPLILVTIASRLFF